MSQENLPFRVGDKIMIINDEDIMHGFVGKVVSHIYVISGTPQVKVKFEFKKGDRKPIPKGYACKASNIQFRIFDITDLIMDTKLNKLLYS